MIDLDNHTCQCSEPGHCPVFDKPVMGRWFEHCKGTSGVASEKRQNFLAILAGLHPTAVKVPNALEKAANFTGAAVRAFQEGFRKVPPEVEQARRQHCNACSYRDKEKDECTLCGCPLSGQRVLGNKLELATERCALYKINLPVLWDVWKPPQEQQPTIKGACRYLGAETGEYIGCGGCQNKETVAVHFCSLEVDGRKKYIKCTADKALSNLQCCASCTDRIITEEVTK